MPRNSASLSLIAIVERFELSVRLSILALFKKQRNELPVNEIIENNGVPGELIQKWNDEFKAWFVSKDATWRRVWSTSINKIEMKITTAEAYDDYIIERSFFIGTELANVQTEAIGVTLNIYGEGSVQKLKKHLKDVIGLQTGQANALARQTTAILKVYSGERAQRRIDRLYRRKLNYRSQLIARTELSTAVNEAQLVDINSRVTSGALPPETEKRWSTVGDDRVSEGCQENESDGWILMNNTFTSGHAGPPRFPGCRCALQFRAKQAA